MEIKAGYKQTEIGVIPEDWSVRPLSELTSEIGDGIHTTPAYSRSSDYYFINGNNLVDGSIKVTDTTMCVGRSEWLKLRKKLGDKTILISINGTIGNLAFYNGEQVVLGKSAAYLNVAPAFSNKYIFYTLSTSHIAKYIENELTGSTIKNLSLASLRNLPIAIPNRAEEQKAIAAALSDTDTSLRTLDELLAKKRDIKQAAMQQLLTGKTRLPGFGGEWERRNIGSITDIDPDNLGSETALNYQFKYISLEDVDNGQLRSFSEQVFQTAPSRARRKVRKGDVLISTVRPNLKSHLLMRDFASDTVCSTGFSVARCKPGIADPAYLYHHLFAGDIQAQINTLITGSNYPAINSRDVKALTIPLPTLEEQAAIATVLSDMDAELAAVQQARDKTRAVKQGMMQELLTGRTRLV